MLAEAYRTVDRVLIIVGDHNLERNHWSRNWQHPIGLTSIVILFKTRGWHGAKWDNSRRPFRGTIQYRKKELSSRVIRWTAEENISAEKVLCKCRPLELSAGNVSIQGSNTISNKNRPSKNIRYTRTFKTDLISTQSQEARNRLVTHCLRYLLG